MKRYAVFIRNIVVGRNRLHRETLINAFSQHGAARVQSVLATGNLIFDAEPSRVDGTVHDAQQTLRSIAGLQEPMFLRSFAQLKTLADSLPFCNPRFGTVHRPGQPGRWIEKQTGSLVTTRNWKTIARLLER